MLSSAGVGWQEDDSYAWVCTPQSGVLQQCYSATVQQCYSAAVLQQLVPVVDEATGKLGSTICLMTVVQVHVHEEAFNAETGTVVAEALRPISRLGGNTYGQTRENFDILRPGAEGAARAKAMRFG